MTPDGRDDDTQREAGAVVVRGDGPELRVLLITSKGEPDHWLFPKGHIEAGETAEVAASREAREEAGVEVIARQSIGTTSFLHEGRRFVVEYFFCDYVGDGATREGRSLEWLSFADAERRLSFAELHSILERAASIASSRAHR